MKFTLRFRAFLLFFMLFFLHGCQTTIDSSAPVLPDKLTQSYQCKNDIEVQCTTSRCSSEPESFTPMSISFDTSGDVNVCAYSGCWKGHADVSVTAQFIVLTGNNLSFSNSDDKQSIAITLDLSDNVAVLKVDSFAQPLLCDANTL